MRYVHCTDELSEGKYVRRFKRTIIPIMYNVKCVLHANYCCSTTGRLGASMRGSTTNVIIHLSCTYIYIYYMLRQMNDLKFNRFRRYLYSLNGRGKYMLHACTLVHLRVVIINNN